MAGVNGQFVKSPSLLTGLGKPPRHRDSPGEDLSGDRPDLEPGWTYHGQDGYASEPRISQRVGGSGLARKHLVGLSKMATRCGMKENP